MRKSVIEADYQRVIQFESRIKKICRFSARAIVLNAPIFYEMTAHLDTKGEKQLNTALNRAAKWRTVISLSIG